MGGPSSHLTAEHTQTVAINISEKSMPSSGAGGGGTKPRVRRGFDQTDPSTLNGDYRRPRGRLRKRRWVLGVARCRRSVTAVTPEPRALCPLCGYDDGTADSTKSSCFFGVQSGLGLYRPAEDGGVQTFVILHFR